MVRFKKLQKTETGLCLETWVGISGSKYLFQLVVFKLLSYPHLSIVPTMTYRSRF